MLAEAIIKASRSTLLFCMLSLITRLDVESSLYHNLVDSGAGCLEYLIHCNVFC